MLEFAFVVVPRLIVLAIGGAAVWFGGSTISGVHTDRAPYAVRLRTRHWLALVIGFVAGFMLAGPPFESVYVGIWYSLVALVAPAVLMVVGAVLVDSVRGIILGFACVAAGAYVSYVPSLIRFERVMYRYSLPFHLAWDAAAASISWIVFAWVSIALGMFVHWRWRQVHGLD